ncbi:MAG: GntR family transcriptional regulator, partial [Rhodobacter sp.]|nr:GntR family transcriptional regulator [Rhodobacter sp.]
MSEPSSSPAEAAHDAVLAAIRAGDLVPGDRLREADLAGQLGLSRTPVREALRRLEVQGIVEHRPRVGAVIRSLSHSEVVQLYEMRVILERTAAEMAAQHATGAELDEIGDLNAALAKATEDPRRAADLNARFHECIALAARNRFLLDALQALAHSLLVLGPTTLEDGERISTVVKQHAA